MKKIAALFQRAENWLVLAAHKFLNKGDQDIVKAAEVADKWIVKLQDFLDSQVVVDFAKLIPEAEPAREAIVAIANQLQTDFEKVAKVFQPGLVTAAGASMTQVIHTINGTAAASDAAYHSTYINTAIKIADMKS